MFSTDPTASKVVKTRRLLKSYCAICFAPPETSRALCVMQHVAGQCSSLALQGILGFRLPAAFCKTAPVFYVVPE